MTRRPRPTARPVSARPVTLAMLALCPATAAPAAPSLFRVSAPAGFDTLLAPQETVVDVYSGGRPLGQARVRFSSGRVTFLDVDALLALVPDLIDPATARTALAQPDLDSHAGLICPADADPTTCGTLKPADAGVIFDAARFRIDLFFHPRLLAVHRASERRYLPTPDARLSLIDQIGGTIAGSAGFVDYTIQNRAIVALGNARIRNDLSYSSYYGLVADTLAAELDTRDYRYSAGVLWAPGIDLTGRRKLLGVGVQSQIDTRLDRTLIAGSPLVVSLALRSRVDILRDGRLLTSRTYEPGNQSLDTTSLPDGAYELVLHIVEAGGATRDERRFFTKNAAIAAIGDPIVFGYAGVLANDRRGRLVAPSRTLFYEAGIARRFTPQLALDATLMGTNRTALLEIGGYWLGPVAQLRTAGLVSVRGQTGVLVQAASSGTAGLTYTFDLRRVWSRRGRDLIPIMDGILDRPGLVTPDRAQFAAGAFTQFYGTISYSLPRGQAGLSGFYRRDARAGRSYGIGPSASVPLVQRGGFQLMLRADATLTNRGHSAYVGISLQRLRGATSLAATGGFRANQGDEASTAATAVGGIAASWQKDNVLGGDLSASGGLEREVYGTLARAHADLRTGLGSLFADVAQPIGGNNGSTQYSLSFQTSAAAVGGNLVMQGRDRHDSVIVVQVSDNADDAAHPPATPAPFEVLVDNAARGIVRAGGTLSVAVPAYRQYAVRLRPVGEELTRLDGGTRQVSVYPGTVARVAWSASRVTAMFGRIVWPDGSPVADAAITTIGAIGSTDAAGYFQVEAASNAVLDVRSSDGRRCRIAVRAGPAKEGYAALGSLTCRPVAAGLRLADVKPDQ
ncbi:TcfC E-set like domain-containing protein [Sphingomonas prati]|uniref:Fimbrial biogenesis outer membrane usher protein n=1 Tax=Sphingomonas prati TaxID=1843237 RepID=A0A7W9BVA6_9SPHN|nr:TcfC E-set like domain-containing protein [Sphingomonas prati]MBB5730706.1 hypothetical protein [Sphingomonas prati]